MMGISTIPNPDFVFCTNCSYRTRKKVFNKRGQGHTIRYFCKQSDKPRPLYGQKGCDRGKRRRLRFD